MGAIQEAIKLYGADTFSRLHGLYSEHGYVYSEPSMLALARPCNSLEPHKWIETRDADAWWVELVVGKDALRHLYAHIPFPLAKIGWRRDFKSGHYPRFYNFYKLKDKLNGN